MENGIIQIQNTSGKRRPLHNCEKYKKSEEKQQAWGAEFVMQQ
jgi:hypothetical protein